MKKILLTINDLSTTGGAERVVVNLANALSEYGFDVCILSFYKSNKTLPFDVDKNIKIFYKFDVSEQEFLKRHSKNWFKKMYFKNLHKHFLSAWVKKTFDVDVIIASCNTFFPFFKKSGVKYLRIEHSNFAFNYKKYLNSENPKPRSRHFDALVVLNQSEIELYKKIHKNVFVIKNFLPNFPAQNANLNSKIVLAVGRLSSEKGFLRLVDVWNVLWKKYGLNSENLKGWELHIVGSGEQENEIREKIQNLNSQNARDSIKMFAFTKEIDKHYLNASIYTMASELESFGMVVAEAGSFGVPCIAFDIASGPSDIIENGKSGFLIENGNLDDFADKLFLLISESALREQMGANAKKIIAQNFSKEAIIKKWLEIL